MMFYLNIVYLNIKKNHFFIDYNLFNIIQIIFICL